jgi:hypothetical protein
MTNQGRDNIGPAFFFHSTIPLAIEVWIYFSFLEFWPGAYSGTIVSAFGGQYYPQDVVLPFDPTSKIGRQKEPLTEFSALLPFRGRLSLVQ